MATKRAGGGFIDIVDIVQQHNRNVALQAQADAGRKQQRAAEEQARQARLDREANDRHRAQLEAIAKQRAAIEAQRVQILQNEQKAKEFAKQQNNLIYDISCQLKSWDAEKAPFLEKIRKLYKLKNDLEKIVLDAVTDLQYKSLYSETQNLWQQLSDKFRLEHACEFAVYQKYRELEQQVDLYIEDFKISSVNEMLEAQHLAEELKNFSAEHPEFDFGKDEIGLVLESMNGFMQTAATMKGLWKTLNAERKITSKDTLIFLLCTYFEIDENVFSSDLWHQLNEGNCSRVIINQFCDFCLKTMKTNASLSDTVLQIFDSIEDPQTVPAIQSTRKMLYSKLINRLKARNQSAKKSIDRRTRVGCGCFFFLISLIAAPFFPWAIIVAIIATIVIIKQSLKQAKLEKLPLPVLEASLKSKSH